MTNEEAKGIIESLLLISEKPLLVNEIKEVVEELDSQLIRKLVLELKSEYETSQRGFRINEVAGGFELSTAPESAAYLKRLYKSDSAQRLSGPALETLAIVAYRQPVTRADIETIRGVNVDGVLETLVEKGLVRVTGRRESLGRPMLYGTTPQFLSYFGLNSIAELPRLNEVAQEVKDDVVESAKKD